MTISATGAVSNALAARAHTDGQLGDRGQQRPVAAGTASLTRGRVGHGDMDSGYSERRAPVAARGMKVRILTDFGNHPPHQAGVLPARRAVSRPGQGRSARGGTAVTPDSR